MVNRSRKCDKLEPESSSSKQNPSGRGNRHLARKADVLTLTTQHRLVGLVVKASTWGAEGPEFESCLRRDFSGSSHTCDFKIGNPVATLPGAWHYRVSAGTGQPGVSIL